MKYKTISLLQPWATLFAMGLKKVETRSWATKYRGPLLIHASGSPKKKNDIGRALWDTGHCNTIIDIDYDRLPFGALIGMVNIADVFRFDTSRSVDYLNNLLHDEMIREVRFGDWGEGRYGWLADKAYSFTEPIPAKGHLSIWEWEGSLHPQQHGMYAHMQEIAGNTSGKQVSLFK